MENVICTVVKEKTAEEFISVLNKYGLCIDYSNDYERSKSLQGIFVGVINKVYDVVWKGEGGHLEHDSLFMSAQSLLYCKRESEPFRIGFVGKIVSQLVEINLKEGDAIGILKPKFFYALDIPTLCAGVGNVVVWVAKDLKNHGVIEEASQSSDENQYFQSLKKTNNHTDNNRKRIPFIDEDSDTHSLGKSSTSGTLRHDVQIFRSRPAVLKRPVASAKNRSAPDSTTRTLVRKRQNNICDENENPSENVLTENIVSQNTANVGSAADNSCINKIEDNLICNLDSAVKSVRYDSCRSCHKVPNNTCGSHSHITCHKANCCGSRVSCCNYHIVTANHCKEISCSQNYRSSCACFSNHHCSRIRNCCCAHNAEPQCMHWNSANSCRTDNSLCNRHFELHSRPMKSCCVPCDSQIMKCCNSHCQSGCIKSKCFHRPTNLDKTTTSCCNKQISAPIQCHNLYCCNHERVNTFENTRASHCCDSRNKANPKLGNANEEEGTELSEESNINSRTKEWVSNWVENPPHLLPDGIEASKDSGTSSQNPLLESRHSVVETGVTCSKQRLGHSITSNPTNFISDTVLPKHVAKKIKLFTPLENSTIISEKSVYRNATIVEESTPFDSENYSDTPRDPGLSADKNQEPKDKNVTNNINLPLSNNNGLDDTLEATLKDPPAAKEVNNTIECAEERLCPETNAKESPITNQLQNKDILSGENKNSSEEPFPELWIETPIISQTCTEPHIDQNRIEISNKTNQGESCIGDHDEVSCSNDNICSYQQSKETTTVEKINPHIEKIDEGSNKNKESSIEKVSDVHEMECDGKNDSGINESNFVPSAKNKDSSSSKSLALQDHSKSNKEVDTRMDLTLVNVINKEGMKRSKESSDDAMELTCESLVMKRRKKEKFRKARSVGSLCSGRNNHGTSVSSSDTFYDVRSDGILSLRSNKWCLKPIKEVFDKPLCRKVIEGLSLQNNSPYNLNLFSTFNVVGAIINIFPSLSQENFGNLVEGFCNEGCRKKYSYEDYKEVESICAHCTFCRYNYHLACPGCSQSGLERPLCLYFNFEIHLFDGENVLRIEIDHKSGVDFLGCTPQHYLNSGTIYKKINKIIFPILQDQWVNPILLKAKVKVNCKSGATVLQLNGTSLKKHLILKGQHYKL